MTRRFCDICEKPLTPEDDLPFIRHHKTHDAQIMLAVTNSVGGVLPDICQNCKLEMAIDGLLMAPIRPDCNVAKVEPTSPPSPMRTHGGAGAPFVRSQPQPNGEEGLP